VLGRRNLFSVDQLELFQRFPILRIGICSGEQWGGGILDHNAMPQVESILHEDGEPWTSNLPGSASLYAESLLTMAVGRADR